MDAVVKHWSLLDHGCTFLCFLEENKLFLFTFSWVSRILIRFPCEGRFRSVVRAAYFTADDEVAGSKSLP